MNFRDDILQKDGCILWGKKRHIFEFAYMFDTIDYYGYIPIDDGEYEIELNRLSVSDIAATGDNKNFLLVICDYDIERYINVIKQNNLESKIEYACFEEYFWMLDSYNERVVQHKKIAVWGTGETQKNLSGALKKNYCDIDIELYIDSNPEKCNGEYCGRPVKTLSEIEDIHEYFIIVASIYYHDIEKELQEFGLEEGKDYLPFSALMCRPSAMFREQTQATEIVDFYCDRPFTFLYYAWFGAYSCCSTWVKYPIGNPAADSPEKCWNSIVAKLYRISALTRTYCFCKKDACGIMNHNGQKNEKMKIHAIPERLVLGLDYSCNLHCTSCRNCTEVASGEQLRVREQFADEIIRTGWLEQVKVLELSGAGEALFSKIDRKILFSNEKCKRESIYLLSNGILLNDDNLNKLIQCFSTVRLEISIDAASEETYLKIRRGGNWNTLIRNLEKISVRRQKEEIKYVEIRMVVQKNNFREMEEFICMGKKYHFDRVVFTKLLNWDMYSEEDYCREALLEKGGEDICVELKRIFQKDIFKDSIVCCSEFERYLDDTAD